MSSRNLCIERNETFDPMNIRSLRSSLLLLLASLIWGLAFVAQRVGMDYMPPFAFNGIRTLMASAALLPVILFMDRKQPARRSPSPAEKKNLRTASCLCGLLLCLSTNLQQAGLVSTSAGKGGFITALYVVLVPVAGWLFFRRNPGKWIWLSVLMAVFGLFLLCVPAGERFVVSQGDLLILGCAIAFAGHILVVDHFSPLVDGLRLSCCQFLFCGVASLILSLLTESFTLSGLWGAMPAMLYAGILSGAVGYTIQILAQRNVNPTLASILMCMESVFSVLGGALLLGETLTRRESLGCAIMFAAVILAQLSPALALKKRVPAS